MRVARGVSDRTARCIDLVQGAPRNIRQNTLLGVRSRTGAGRHINCFAVSWNREPQPQDSWNAGSSRMMKHSAGELQVKA